METSLRDESNGTKHYRLDEIEIVQLVVSRESDLHSVPYNRPVGIRSFVKKCQEYNAVRSVALQLENRSRYSHRTS